MSAPAIETQGLTKRYGDHVAVSDLNLRIDPGTVFGLLGPNGSGKTTTILMVLGLTEVTSGSVRVGGFDPARRPLDVKRIVGYMPDTVGFYDDMTARENLRFTGKLARLQGDALENRIGVMLDRVSLADVSDDRVKTFSRGMRQRLGLADVLLKEPRIVILDEPTNGLDPQATHEFLGMIRQLKADGLTVLLCSHQLERVEAVCDRVGLFNRGRMVLEGAVDDLARRVMAGGYSITVETAGDGVEAAFRDIPGVNRIEPTGHATFRLHADADVRQDVVRAVASCRGALLGLTMEKPSLDDIYTQYFEEVSHAA